MIDKAYWKKIAAEWKKEDDGLVPPPPPPTPVILTYDSDGDEEIDSILADLGLDDI